MDVGVGLPITAQGTQWKMSVPLLQPIIFVQNPQQVGRGNMTNYGSVKIVNITIENASRIEKMVNKAISDLNKQKIKILDLQTTEDNIDLVLPKIIEDCLNQKSLRNKKSRKTPEGINRLLYSVKILLQS